MDVAARVARSLSKRANSPPHALVDDPGAGASFIGIGDLLAGCAPSHLSRLAPPRQRAPRVALLLEDPHGPKPNSLAIGLGLLDLLRSFAADRPVLVAIDDIQWLEPDSRFVLSLAARRLTDEPVAFLFTTRPGAPVDPLPSPQPTPGDQIERVRLGPLSIGALHVLFLQRTGQVLPRPALRALHDLSGGNPFYALELATAYQRGLIVLRLDEPIPAGLDAVVTARLAALPIETQRCLTAVAAVSRPTLTLRRQVMDSGADPENILAPAVSEDIVSIHGEEVSFRHPLLAAAALGLLGE